MWFYSVIKIESFSTRYLSRQLVLQPLFTVDVLSLLVGSLSRVMDIGRNTNNLPPSSLLIYSLWADMKFFWYSRTAQRSLSTFRNLQRLHSISGLLESPIFWRRMIGTCWIVSCIFEIEYLFWYLYGAILFLLVTEQRLTHLIMRSEVGALDSTSCQYC